MDTFGEDVGCLARRRTPNAHSLEAAAQKREKDRDRDGERETDRMRESVGNVGRKISYGVLR